MLRDIQDEIIRLKKEKDIYILAHSYQSEAVTEVADFCGDSYALAKQAAKTESSAVLMCGVRFMAEGVKLLCPDKKVILSHPEACCPMAEQFSADEVRAFRAANPDYAVVAYINTTAELKTVCDVCVTSSSAVKIVSKMPEKNILFIPDCNLGAYVSERCPDKNIKLWRGGCPIHAAVDDWEAKAAKEAHPGALMLVHPECMPEVVKLADFVGSTAEIMKFAKESDARDFIIGTELSILEHLQFACPEKRFYPMSKNLVCRNMKLTTLCDVLECVRGEGGEVIEIDDETANAARRCLDKMIELG